MDTHSGKPMSITRRQVGYWLLIIVVLQILGPGMGHEMSIEVNRQSGQVNLGAVIIHRIELLVDLLGLAGLACGLLCLWLDRSRLIWRCSIGLIIAQQVIIPAAIAWRRDITSYLHSSLISDELTVLFGTKTDSGHMRDSILSWCVLPCLAYVIWKLWRRGGEPAKTRPDFYISSSEGYGLETPRACRCIRRMSLGDRSNLMLVEISPALPVQTSGSGGRDVTLLLLSPRHAGRTLWPINEWPMHVHVFLPLIDDPAQRDRVEPDEVRHLAWAELNKENARQWTKRELIPMSVFKSNILNLVQSELEKRGIRKQKLGLSFLVLDSDVIGTINLSTGKGLRTDELAIWPMIGVRNQKIGRLVSDIMGEKFSKFYPPHACSNIGYLMPEKRWKTFIFCETTPPEDAVRELVDAVEFYAVPFMRRVTDLKELVYAIGVERISLPETRIYHIPAGLFLLGDNKGSESFLDDKLEEFSKQDNPASKKFRLFAAGLRQEIKKSQNP